MEAGFRRELITFQTFLQLGLETFRNEVLFGKSEININFSVESFIKAKSSRTASRFEFFKKPITFTNIFDTIMGFPRRRFSSDSNGFERGMPINNR